MKAKRFLGAGVSKYQNKLRRKRRKHRKKGTGLTFNQLVNKARRAIKGKKSTDIRELATQSLAAIKKYKVKNRPKRMLKLTKIGSGIPIVPIITALSHVGDIVGGITSIIESIHKIKSIHDEYKQQKAGSGVKRLPVHIGHGLSVHPYKTGIALKISK